MGAPQYMRRSFAPPGQKPVAEGRRAFESRRAGRVRSPRSCDSTQQALGTITGEVT